MPLNFFARRSVVLAAILLTIVNCFLFFSYGKPLRELDVSLPSFTNKKYASLLRLPAEYGYNMKQPSFCSDRFTHIYLENLSDNVTEYCDSDAQSSLTCFHSRTVDSRVDSFCFGKGATFSPDEKNFDVPCKLRGLSDSETARGVPTSMSLQSYWYDTGPGMIMKKYIRLLDPSGKTAESDNFTILVKREGSGNLWHCLMEIFSMTLTMDALRMTPDENKGVALFSERDIENTQVLILDDHEDGPYFDLWKLFAGRPTIRLHEIAEQRSTENVIIPLAGGSNPLWQGDWDPHPCWASDLVQVLSRRILNFYNITDTDKTRDPQKIAVTYIDRMESRRVINHEIYFNELEQKYAVISVRSVDFASMDFQSQLKIVQGTDILVGVHGAGLTHALFLPPDSVVVEIQPSTLNHKGFRNLARLLGHSYYTTHASETAGNAGGDWHRKDVEIDKDHFFDLMDMAIKSLYSKGLRDYDVI